METNKCDLSRDPLAFLLRYLLKIYIFLSILDLLQSTTKRIHTHATKEWWWTKWG